MQNTNTLFFQEEVFCDKKYNIEDNRKIFLNSGNNLILFNDLSFIDKNIEIDEKKIVKLSDLKKLNNNKINILYCSDQNYFVGLFASLCSVIKNTRYLENLHFNFIIPDSDSEEFLFLITKLQKILNCVLDKTVVYINENIIPESIKKSKCYNGGEHLLNIGNFSRMIIGEIFNYKKLIYLDADSICQCDLYLKLHNFNLNFDLYSLKQNINHEKRENRIILKMKNIINITPQWKNIINKEINGESYAFMGAPFITDCTKWSGVIEKLIKIIKLHNRFEGGLYKLFTMSLQNIIFYEKTGNIKDVICSLPDLGSTRKKWTCEQIENSDILDWSGSYKPWFKNGLYRDIWNNYDILNLKTNKEIFFKKKTIETFQ